MSIIDVLSNLSIDYSTYKGKGFKVTSPIDGKEIASIIKHKKSDAEAMIASAHDSFYQWKDIPMPARGELVRQYGETLRKHKEELATIVTHECGKIIEEARGEIQEMIDICDYAVGLSRTIGGQTLPSERADHVLHENWLPLGPVAVISAFNFPAAVWSWNAMLAFVCGDPVIWKPSEKTPVTAIACHELFVQVHQASEFSHLPCLSQLVIGDGTIGQLLCEDVRIALVSATGSCAMGKKVAPIVAARMGRCLLELGGNNAAIISEHADLEVALPSIVFGAVGTAGQRCTTTRRLFIHESKFAEVVSKIKQTFTVLEDRIGNPMNHNTLIGPLIDKHAFKHMQDALKHCKRIAKEIHGGQRVLQLQYEHGYYAAPALVVLDQQYPQVMEETFAPILYAMPYSSLEEVMHHHNAVPQGLSSTIFTNDVREAEYFKRHSDCGIANVNIGTSGAEIGGAFGGEKETGGGRESGSDSWKAYMRRQTSTTYYGNQPPALAQGIQFNLND